MIRHPESPRRARAPAYSAVACAALATLATTAPAMATDIFGPLPAALDQPRINAYFSRTQNGPPMVADFFGFQTFTVQAFLDTGASGILISVNTAELMGNEDNPPGIQLHTHNGQQVLYQDVGVGGTSNFNVSEQLYTYLAPFHPGTDIDNIDTYQTVYNQSPNNQPIRAQIGPVDVDFENPLLADLDVFGMPVMMNKVAVFDPTPVDTIALIGDFSTGDTMRTYLYDPGTPHNPAQRDTNPGIPDVNRTIKLSYGDFDRFTQIRLRDTSTEPPTDSPPLSESEAAPLRPTLNHNPFIGPDPVAALDPGAPPDPTPPITISYGAETSQGSWLLDTGAAASLISTEQALSLGLTVDESDPENPTIVGLEPGAEQFTITIAGIGGQRVAAGFYLDTLTIPTMEGDPLVFHDAPVLIGDITVADPTTGQQLTLDGIFGMNYLVASANLTGDIINPIDALAPGAFNWAVFDEAAGTLGLKLKADYLPIPTWNNMTGGAWSTGANWTNGVPNAIGSIAWFGDAINAPRTVTVDGAKSVGQIIFDSTHAYTLAGTGTITLDNDGVLGHISVDAGSHTIAAPLALKRGTLINVIEPGSTLTIANMIGAATPAPIWKDGAGTLVVNRFQVSSLAVRGGTVRVAPGGTPASVSRVASLVVESTAVVDLTNNDLLIDYFDDEPTPFGDVEEMMADGRLTSSAAAATIDQTIALVDNAELGRSSWRGESIDLSTIIAAYTYFGDANLDGKVTGDDYLNVDANLGTGSRWFEGDFNGDGVTTGDDYLAIDANLGKGTLNPAAFAELKAEMVALHAEMFGEGYLAMLAIVEAEGFAAVPEPGATVALFGAAGALAMRRRSRLRRPVAL